MRYFRRHDFRSDNTVLDADLAEPALRSTNIRALGAWNPEHAVTPYVDATIDYEEGTELSPHVFSSIYADSGLRHAVPTVAALTLLEPRYHFDADRRSVAPSSDLSRHSSPLVKQAQRMGLVVPSHWNPEAGVTNGLTLRSLGYGVHITNRMEAEAAGNHGGIVHFSTTPWERIPDEQVREARSMVRQIIASNPRSQRKAV